MMKQMGKFGKGGGNNKFAAMQNQMKKFGI
jgi:hypothetical protein